MKRTLLRLGVAAGLTAGVGALERPCGAADFPFGIFKRRQPAKAQEPPKPEAPKAEAPRLDTRARQLAALLQSEQDIPKRREAIKELAGFDPRTDADVLPTLVSSLRKDPAPEVRADAAEAIGRLKPVSQSAGLALEDAGGTDPNVKVREAVNLALLQYHLNGYRTQYGTPLSAQQSDEPRLSSRPTTTRESAKPGVPNEFVRRPVTFQPITSGVGKALSFVPTGEPPLAKRVTTTAPAPVLTAPQQPAAPAPLPQTVTLPPSVPTPMPQVLPAAPVVPTPPGVGGIPVPVVPLPPVPVPPTPPAPGGNF